MLGEKEKRKDVSARSATTTTVATKAGEGQALAHEDRVT
jgi:hypothetical protein